MKDKLKNQYIQHYKSISELLTFLLLEVDQFYGNKGSYTNIISLPLKPIERSLTSIGLVHIFDISYVLDLHKQNKTLLYKILRNND